MGSCRSSAGPPRPTLNKKLNIPYMSPEAAAGQNRRNGVIEIKR